MKNMDSVGNGDVVILPAFGASLEEMQELDAKNVQVVDTTCPWVSKVWNTVDKHTKVRVFLSRNSCAQISSQAPYRTREVCFVEDV